MNTELEDRLQALGAHLDAERAAHASGATAARTTSNVVALDSRRRGRVMATAAAVVLVAAGVAAIALNRGNSPDPSVPATDPTTVGTTTPSTVAPTTVAQAGDLGTLTIEYLVDEGDPNDVVDRLNSRGAAMSLDSTVTADGSTITVVVHGITSEEQTTVTRAMNSVADAVQLRPVTAACAVQGGVDLTAGSDPGLTQLLGLLGDPANQACEVGPSLGTGAVFERDAVVQPIDASTPAVVVSLRPGAAGTDVWNTLAGHCYQKDPTCPTGQLAIELGGWLYSAPTVQTPVFEGSVMIAGSFSDLDAAALADALNHDDPTFRLTTKSYVFDFGG